MLLIWSCRDDNTVDWFNMFYLEYSDIEWCRFNTEDFPESVSIEVAPDHCGLIIDGLRIEINDVTAVWYRRPLRSVFRNKKISHKASEFINSESDRALLFVRTHLKNATWVNWPENNQTASNKIEQLSHASRVGFGCPETLVTNNPDKVLELYDNIGGTMIVKPLHKGTISVDGQKKLFFTSEVSRKILKENIEAIAICPEMYQRKIPRLFDIRVVVIGKKCFAVRIEAPNEVDEIVDWRRDPYHCKYVAMDLPQHIAEKCVKMTMQCGLLFSAFDFILSKDEEYVFLEHNPNGQFAWLEEATGMPMGLELLNLFNGVT